MQWIRRCKQEELNLIDSFAGPKADRIQQSQLNGAKMSFYPTPNRMTNVSSLTNGAPMRPQHEESKHQ